MNYVCLVIAPTIPPMEEEEAGQTPEKAAKKKKKKKKEEDSDDSDSSSSSESEEEDRRTGYFGYGQPYKNGFFPWKKLSSPVTEVMDEKVEGGDRRGGRS